MLFPRKVNETGSSSAMELEGAKRCFREISDAGLKVETFVSDRHRGIAKWIKGDHPNKNHFFHL